MSDLIKSIDVNDEGDASYTVHQLVWHLRGTFMEQEYEKVERLLVKREERIRAEMEREVEKVKRGVAVEIEELKKVAKAAEVELREAVRLKGNFNEEMEALRVENSILKDATQKCSKLMQSVKELEAEVTKLKLKVREEESLRKNAENDLRDSETVRAQMEMEVEVKMKEMEEVVEKLKGESKLKIDELRKMTESAEAKHGEAAVLKLVVDEYLMNCKKECEVLRGENLKLKDAIEKMMCTVKELEGDVNELKLQFIEEENLRKQVKEELRDSERARAQMEIKLEAKMKEMEEVVGTVKQESALKIEELRKVVKSAEAKHEEVVVLNMIGNESLMTCKKESEVLRVENLKLKDAIEMMMRMVKELGEDVNELTLQFIEEENLRKQVEEELRDSERDRAHMEMEVEAKMKEMEEVKQESALKIEELRKVAESAEAKHGEALVLKLIADENLRNCKNECEALRSKNLSLKDKLMKQKKRMSEVDGKERVIELEFKSQEEEESLSNRNNTEEVLLESERKVKELELIISQIQKEIHLGKSILSGDHETGLGVENSHQDVANGKAEIPFTVQSDQLCGRNSVPAVITAANNAIEGVDLINSTSTATMKQSSLGVGVKDACVDREKQRTEDVIPRNKLEELRAKHGLGRNIEVINVSEDDDDDKLPLGSKNRPSISSIKLENESDTPEISSGLKRKSMASIDVVKTEIVSPNRLSKKIKEFNLTPCSSIGNPKLIHYDQAKEIAVDNEAQQWRRRLLEKLRNIPCDDDVSDCSG